MVPSEMVPFRVRLVRADAAVATSLPAQPSATAHQPAADSRALTPRKVPAAPPTAGIGAYSYRVNTAAHELLRRNERVPLTTGPHGPVPPYGQDPARQMVEARALTNANVAFNLAQLQLDKKRAQGDAKRSARELPVWPQNHAGGMRAGATAQQRAPRASTAPAVPVVQRSATAKGRDQGVSAELSEKLHDLRTNPMQLDEFRAQIREGRRRHRLQKRLLPVRRGQVHTPRGAVGEHAEANTPTLAKAARAARASARGTDNQRRSEDDEAANAEDNERLRVQESLDKRNSSALTGHLERIDVGRKLALLTTRRVR